MGGCSPQRAARRPNAASAPSNQSANTAPSPTSTTHNWQYRSGQDYAYQEDVSQDPKRAGQAAATVQIYRYLGEHEGVFALQFGGHTVTCANPCQVIHVSDGGFHVERVAFDPNTIIGAALTDAFNGQLQIYDPANRARH